MKLKEIRTHADYERVIARIGDLMKATPSTPEEELEVLSLLVESYEDEHYPIKMPEPVEAIKAQMEQQGLTRKDLIPYIGSQSKVSEVLNRKRPLTLNMIRGLNECLGIPLEVLIQKPEDIESDLEEAATVESFEEPPETPDSKGRVLPILLSDEVLDTSKPYAQIDNIMVKFKEQVSVFFPLGVKGGKADLRLTISRDGLSIDIIEFDENACDTTWRDIDELAEMAEEGIELTGDKNE